jgi:hypothetical protein
MPSSIVPAARPDLALTLVTEGGKPGLALLPKDAANRLQLFDICPGGEAPLGTAASTSREPHALLVKAGAKAGVPKMPADYVGEAHIVDFIVAFMKGDGNTRSAVINSVIQDLLDGYHLDDAIARASNNNYQIQLVPDLVGKYLTLIRQPTPNAGMAAFLKRVNGNKAVMNQLIAASTDYNALARAISANGFAISPQDLQSYLSSWQFFSSVLTGLKDSGEISDSQYEERVGYKSGDYNITGLGPEADQALVGGFLSASGWVNKLDGVGDLTLPMEAFMIPVSTIMVDGLTGQQNFSFKELGPMMFDGFVDGMQATADGLQSFGNSVSSIF